MDTFYLKRWENPITRSESGLITGCCLLKICSNPITLSASEDTVLTGVRFISTYFVIFLGFLDPGFLLFGVEVFNGSIGLGSYASLFASKGNIDM